VAGQQGPRGFPGIPTKPLGVAIFTNQGAGGGYTFDADQTDFPITLAALDRLGPDQDAPFGIPGLYVSDAYGTPLDDGVSKYINIPAGTYYVEAAVNVGSADLTNNDDVAAYNKRLVLLLDNASSQQNLCGMQIKLDRPSTAYLSSYLKVTATTLYTFHMKTNDILSQVTATYAWFSGDDLSNYSSGGNTTDLTNSMFQNSVISFIKIA
jgi:hypothetical protein